MARFKNVEWNCGDLDRNPSVEHAQLAVMMDIRDELQAIRRLMECPNVSLGFSSMVNASHAAKRIDRRISKRIPLK